MRIVFMGTPEFSVPTLLALHEAGHELATAYTQPPRPAGRGKQLQPSPVQRAAEALGIEARHPETLRDMEAHADFLALEADVAVVVAYGLDAAAADPRGPGARLPSTSTPACCRAGAGRRRSSGRSSPAITSPG